MQRVEVHNDGHRSVSRSVSRQFFDENNAKPVAKRGRKAAGLAGQDSRVASCNGNKSTSMTRIDMCWFWLYLLGLG